MKKRCLIVMTLCSSLWLNAQNFIHPGMLHTQADLDRTKAKVEAGEEPWASAYRKLLTSPHVSLDWKAAPVEKNRTRRPDDLGTRRTITSWLTGMPPRLTNVRWSGTYPAIRRMQTSPSKSLMLGPRPARR